jgi:hypothetical protein
LRIWCCRWIGEVDTKVWMRGSCAAHRLAGAGDVGRDARASPPRRVLHALGDEGHGLEIAVRRDGKAASMMSTPMVSSRLCDFELLLQGHGRAGALLAVAQGGVEDQNAVFAGYGRHGVKSFSGRGLRGARVSWSWFSVPAEAPAFMPVQPIGATSGSLRARAAGAGRAQGKHSIP